MDFELRKSGEIERRYAVAFDYDEWTYTVNENEKEKKEMPRGISRITIEIEH